MIGIGTDGGEGSGILAITSLLDGKYKMIDPDGKIDIRASRLLSVLQRHVPSLTTPSAGSNLGPSRRRFGLYSSRKLQNRSLCKHKLI